MLLSETMDLPVSAEDRGVYVVWDLRDWDGDLETMEQIGKAWVPVHEPPEKKGTITIFPDHVVVDGALQGQISEGWNESAKAVDIDYAAFVGDSLQVRAVKNHIDSERLDIGVFDELEEAVEWMEAQVEG